MKAFVCIGYVYSSIKKGDTCYYIRKKNIDHMHTIITFLHNNEEYYVFESEFNNCFISLSEYRKIKLDKIINNKFLF